MLDVYKRQAHRAHCSNVGVAKLVDTAVVGYLMQKEIDFLGNAVENPVRPFVAILGEMCIRDSYISARSHHQNRGFCII